MPNIRVQIAQAMRSVCEKIRWKPNSAARHLAKRKRQKHLPPDATLADYEQIITSVLRDNSGQVYLC